MNTSLYYTRLFRLCRHVTSARHAALVLLASGLLTCTTLAADSGVLARVGDTEVKVDDIRASLETLDPQQQAALARDPALLNQAVRALLARKVVLNEALAKKWDQTPAFAAQLAKLKESALVESYLQAVSLPPADFPAEADLKAVYEANKAVLIAPRQIRLGQIYLAAPKAADQVTIDKAQTRLGSIQKSLREPKADFAALARAESDEKKSAQVGGELGWLSETQLQPEIRSAISRLLPGAVTDPIRLDDGWHLLKVLEIRESHPLALDEVRAQLAQRIRGERAQTNRQAYLARLLEENPLTVNELALSTAFAAPAK